ncbi:MAG: hypothetical protein EBU96_12040, partial [Actinobacteria bacterium]|nr:hypothetical protein [Actinomycetota bacterium]
TGAFTVGAAEGSGTTDPFFRLAALADVTTNTNGEKITIGTAAFTPSVAGSYTLTIWGDTVADGLLGAGEVSSTITITATAAGAKTEFSNSLGGATTDRVTSLTMAATVPTSRVGVLGSMTASWKVTSSTTGNGLAAGDGIAAGDGAVTVAYQLSKPAGSTAALSAASQTAANTVTTGAVSTETSAQAMTAVTFTPDVAGTYTITAWHDADRDSVVDNGELSASASYVVAADAPVITIKTFNSTSPTGAHGASARGVLMRLTLTNGGVAGSLADGENITVSVSGAAVVSRISTTSYGQVTNTTNSYSINRAQLDSKGRVWVTINDASPETVVATVKGSGGSVKDINQTVSLTFADIQATNPDAVTTFTNTTGVKSTTANTTVGAGGNLGV